MHHYALGKFHQNKPQTSPPDVYEGKQQNTKMPSLIQYGLPALPAAYIVVSTISLAASEGRRSWFACQSGQKTCKWMDWVAHNFLLRPPFSTRQTTKSNTLPNSKHGSLWPMILWTSRMWWDCVLPKLVQKEVPPHLYNTSFDKIRSNSTCASSISWRGTGRGHEEIRGIRLHQHSPHSVRFETHMFFVFHCVIEPQLLRYSYDTGSFAHACGGEHFVYFLTASGIGWHQLAPGSQSASSFPLWALFGPQVEATRTYNAFAWWAFKASRICGYTRMAWPNAQATHIIRGMKLYIRFFCILADIENSLL